MITSTHHQIDRRAGYVPKSAGDQAIRGTARNGPDALVTPGSGGPFDCSPRFSVQVDHRLGNDFGGRHALALGHLGASSSAGLDLI